jgi:hyperosmotically inducible periplasmic protein
MKNINALKATTLALVLFTSASYAIAQDYDDITGWQTPLATEFSKLDASGNGLVLPNEASKDKAFTKKTFAEADADHDGTIDQAEYIQYKSVTAPQDAS